MAAEATVYWPQRRLHGALGAASRLNGEHEKSLWLVGSRAAQSAICVVDITHDRAAVDERLQVVGVCHPKSHRGIGNDGADAELLVVEYETAKGDTESLDRSLRILRSGSTAPASGVVVLYDPEMFTRGLARTGIVSMSTKSRLYPPLRELQDQFDSRAASAASRRPVNSMTTACEMVAYYSIGLPFSLVNAVWQRTVLALLSAPVLHSIPVGRGASAKDYSQCLTVFGHRFSNILTLPEQIRARYRRQRDSGCYTELSDFVMYLVLDYLLGLFFASFVTSTALPAAQDIGLHPLSFLDALRENVVWLMDAPAGFKLNDRLAAILGNGILMWLDFWEFLLNAVVTSPLWQDAVSSPMLQTAATVCWKHAGFTLQLSVISDALWLMTWNSYWVFLYFTKLNAMQLRLLSSLWKLFLGKKNNVLRKRVDSCEYDVNQLLLGTLLFTILVFLVTTNAVFFMSFGIVRFGVWFASAALWIPIVALRGLPLVSVLHRLFKPREYTASLSLETVYEQPPLDTLTVEDISPSRRRARDAVDQATISEYFRRGQAKTANEGIAPIAFRVVTRPSGVGQLFDRLQAYQTQLARSYNGKAVVNSCLFGAEIVPVDASVLFRTHLFKPSAFITKDSSAKQKVE